MHCVTYGRYTKEGIHGLVTHPQSRAEAVGRLLKSFGGKLVSFHMMLGGEIDFFMVSEMPNDIVGGFLLINTMLVRASGSVEYITTLPAFRAEDAVKHMKKAKKLMDDRTYQAPAATDFFPREGL